MRNEGWRKIRSSFRIFIDRSLRYGIRIIPSMNNYLKIVAAMLIWSTWGMMIRWISLPPVVVLFYTALIASVAVPLVLKARGEFALSGVSTVWPLFSVLAFSSIVNNLTYFYALAHTTVSNAVLTHYTAPVFVAAFAPFLITERLQRITLISLPLAVTGMVLIVLAGDGLRSGRGACAGDNRRYRVGRCLRILDHPIPEAQPDDDAP